MAFTRTPDDRLRPARALLAVGLAAVSLLSLWKGKRLRGGLAGLGAVAIGYGATTGADDGTDLLPTAPETNSATEDGRLRCASCGEPIVTGQRRGPDENDRIVHDACLDVPA